MTAQPAKAIKIPGPGHPISIEPDGNRVVVTFGGRVVADTRRALKLTESTIPPVLYIPREDADMSLLERTSHATYCPFKGDASYFSIRAGDRVAENAIWTYEAPYEAVAAIKDHLAFYTSRVDSIEERP
jgi:uncharacterized protein (DUF427 family)